MNPQEQNKKQYDWLKGYQFQPGQSGNPGGRPKGSKSLKTFAREYLESLPPEEKMEFLATLPSDIVWKMAEGNPENNDKIEVTAPNITIAEAIATKYDINTKSESDSQQ